MQPEIIHKSVNNMLGHGHGQGFVPQMGPRPMQVPQHNQFGHGQPQPLFAIPQQQYPPVSLPTQFIPPNQLPQVPANLFHHDAPFLMCIPMVFNAREHTFNYQNGVIVMPNTATMVAGYHIFHQSSPMQNGFGSNLGPQTASPNGSSSYTESNCSGSRDSLDPDGLAYGHASYGPHQQQFRMPQHAGTSDPGHSPYQPAVTNDTENGHASVVTGCCGSSSSEDTELAAVEEESVGEGKMDSPLLESFSAVSQIEEPFCPGSGESSLATESARVENGNQHEDSSTVKKVALEEENVTVKKEAGGRISAAADLIQVQEPVSAGSPSINRATPVLNSKSPLESTKSDEGQQGTAPISFAAVVARGGGGWAKPNGAVYPVTPRFDGGPGKQTRPVEVKRVEESPKIAAPSAITRNTGNGGPQNGPRNNSQQQWRPQYEFPKLSREEAESYPSDQQIYMRMIPREVTTTMISQAMREFGELVDVRLRYHRDPNNREAFTPDARFCFVLFNSPAPVARLLKQGSIQIGGQNIVVRGKPPQSPRMYHAQNYQQQQFPRK